MMGKPEQCVWRALCAAAKRLPIKPLMMRVENRLAEGMPDVFSFGRVGGQWIELKATRWPAMPHKTPLFEPGDIRNAQRSWLRRAARSGISACVVARDAEQHWYVIPAAALESCLRAPAQTTRDAYGCGRSSTDALLRAHGVPDK